MNSFLQKVSDKLERMSPAQIKKLFGDMTESVELRDTVLDTLDEGLILLDRQWRIVYMNRAVGSLVGLNYRNNWLGRKIDSQLVDSDITDFLYSVLRTPAGRDEGTKEFNYSKGDGVKIIRVTVAKGFTMFKGKACDLVRISDITKERLEENRLRRSESLAQMTTMAAGVAHEIKNPLGSISIYLQLLRREFQKKKALTGEQAEKYLAVIGEEIERLNSIVVDFLFAVRPLNADMRKEDVNALVKETACFAEPETEQAGIRLELKLAKALPPLNLDRSLFRQAALNLIKNSVQAISSAAENDGRQGVIGIETRLRNDWVDVVFTDNGCGIPEESLSKVFEPYYTTKETGTGLGLTILFKIIKEHRGDLNVMSKVGEGTSFVLSFPVPADERMKIGYKGPSEGAYEADDTDS